MHGDDYWQRGGWKDFFQLVFHEEQASPLPYNSLWSCCEDVCSKFLLIGNLSILNNNTRLEWTSYGIWTKRLVHLLCLGFGSFQVVNKMHYGGLVLPSQLASFYYSYISTMQLNYVLITTSPLARFFFQLCITVVKNPYSAKSGLWWRFCTFFCITFEGTAFCWLCTAMWSYIHASSETYVDLVFFCMFFNMGVGVSKACDVMGRIFLRLGFKSPSSPFLQVCV